MKKLLVCLLAVIGFVAAAEAQTVVVQNNQGATEQTQDPNIFYINGIPSTQDIGGVEAQPKYKEGGYSYAVFKNYHSFTVTVLYRVIHGNNSQKIGSLVLSSKETKEFYIDYNSPIQEIATITRKL